MDVINLSLGIYKLLLDKEDKVIVRVYERVILYV